MCRTFFYPFFIWGASRLFPGFYPIKKKWCTELNRKFSTKEFQMAKRYLRACSTSLASREMQIKTTLRYHLYLILLKRMWSKGKIHPLLVGMQTCATTLEISVAVSQKIGNQSTSVLSSITLGHIPKICSIILQGHRFNYVHRSIVCNSQNLETT